MNRVQKGLGVVLMGLVGWSPLSAASIRPEPIGSIGWVIESADYSGDVRDQIVRVEGRYTIQVFRDGWTEVPLRLQGGTITAIEVTKKTGDAHLMPRGDSYVLATNRKGTYKVVVKCSTVLTQDNQFEGFSLGIPQATFSTLSLFVPRKEVELRQQDQLYTERTPDGQRTGATLMARLGAAQQIDLRWRTKPAAPVKVEPVLYGEVHTLVTIEDQLARVLSVIEYRMAQGETRELSIEVPSAVNVLNIRGAAIEDWKVHDVQDHKVLAVTLSMPLKDTSYRLILEAEQTIPDGSTDYTLPAIRLTGAKQERGYVAIARAGNIELSPQAMEGINRIDVRELPEALSASAIGTPAVLAFKYHQHPYRVTLTMTRHQDHAVLAAIAERAELASVLTQQGELLTRAVYFIKANKKQYVAVILPKDATLWSCIVNGTSVKPVEGTNHELLVPMDTGRESAQASSVELVYFEHRPELVRFGRLHLQGPILDVPTTIANWAVYAPHDVKFLRVSGNLERGSAPVDFLEEPSDASIMTGPQSQTRVAILEQLGDQVRQFTDKHGAFGGRLKNQSGRFAYGITESKNEPLRTNSNGEAVDAADAANKVELRQIGSDGSEGRERPPATSAPAKDDRFDEELMGEFSKHLQDIGILPLKVRLPKAGTVYHFSRLMTTQDALTLDASFVHLPMPWVPFATFGLVLLPMGGVMVTRFVRK